GRAAGGPRPHPHAGHVVAEHRGVGQGRGPDGRGPRARDRRVAAVRLRAGAPARRPRGAGGGGADASGGAAGRFDRAAGAAGPGPGGAGRGRRGGARAREGARPRPARRGGTTDARRPPGGPPGPGHQPAPVRDRASTAMVLTLGMLLASRAAPQTPEAGAPLLFRDITSEAGIDFQHHAAPEKKFIVESMSGGVALLDYDGDGLLDIYLTDSLTVDTAKDPQAARSALYRNRGGGRFEGVTEKGGVGTPGEAM